MYSQSISLFRRLNRWYSAKSNRRETALQASFAMNLCAVVFAVCIVITTIICTMS